MMDSITEHIGYMTSRSEAVAEYGAMGAREWDWLHETSEQRQARDREEWERLAKIPIDLKAILNNIADLSRSGWNPGDEP